MKTAVFLILILSISPWCRAASDQNTSVGQPSVFWIDGQWQTWNHGAWTSYGQKPTTKIEKPARDRRTAAENADKASDPTRIRRAPKMALAKPGSVQSGLDSEATPGQQGLPPGPPNLAIGQPNLAIGQPTIGIGQPTIGIGQPTIGIGQPTIGIGQSTTAIGQTTIGIGQPAPGIGQTTIGIGQPTIGIGQPTIGIGQPTIGIGQPTIGIGKPNIGIGKHCESQTPKPVPHAHKVPITEKAKD
jgi:hypothetical protein